VGGGTDAQIEILRSFGMATGLAFQIQDDVLNLVGKKESVGKDFRSDITEGKRTLVAIHALHNSPRRERLLAILSERASDPAVLQEAVDILQVSGSIAFAQDYATELVVGAKGGLIEALPKSRSKDLLLSMADFFIKRRS
jgi:geranylgeranyl diphosphate synthase type I